LGTKKRVKTKKEKPIERITYCYQISGNRLIAGENKSFA
jgi:hypothetical protein